jgi:4-hydroxymandelate oxidase
MLDSKARWALLALRIAVGWHFLYEGVSKLLAVRWSSADYLASAEGVFGSLFQAIAGTPWMVRAVDVLNAWGLALVGLLLMLGLVTRAASIAGVAMLALYTLAHPALPGMAGSALGGGSYLIVDRNIVEAVALLVVAALPFGFLWGVDRMRLRRARGMEPAADAGRREWIRDLAGVPALGALGAAVLGSRVGGDKTAAVDAVSGATPLFGATPAPGWKGNLVSVRDFERQAPDYMTSANFAYVSGGAGDEQTLRWNEGAYRQLHLRLQVINSKTEPDTRVQLCGFELPHPILLAPARQADIHPEGEIATVRGAGESGGLTIVSNNATKPLEEISAAAKGPIWFQAYLYKDRERARERVAKAEAAGFQAVCVTVDSASNGPRDRQYRYARMKNADKFRKHHGNPWNWPTTWEDFSWYRSLTKLPVIPKGIMTPDDAERSLDLGADGIYISNHGARNLDGGIAPIQVLPAIAERVNGRVPIIIDGGVRRGTDVLKALTLGATAVAVGRPFLYGLAVDGADGVASVINMLWNELEMAMISTRQESLAALDRETILSGPGGGFFET